MGEVLRGGLDAHRYLEWRAQTQFFEFAHELAKANHLSPHSTVGEKFDLVAETSAGQMLLLPGDYIGRSLMPFNNDETLHLVRPIKIPRFPAGAALTVDIGGPPSWESQAVRYADVTFQFFYGTPNKHGVQELNMHVDRDGDMCLMHSSEIYYLDEMIFSDRQVRETDTEELKQFMEVASTISGVPSTYKKLR